MGPFKVTRLLGRLLGAKGNIHVAASHLMDEVYNMSFEVSNWAGC
jgi:hypothetical protein